MGKHVIIRIWNTHNEYINFYTYLRLDYEMHDVNTERTRDPDQ